MKGNCGAALALPEGAHGPFGADRLVIISLIELTWNGMMDVLALHVRRPPAQPSAVTDDAARRLQQHRFQLAICDG